MRNAMPSVHDVAAYIIQKAGGVSAMKLEKLVYYCQAWSLAWTETRLFPERVEAWANGPVVRELYARHRGEFLVTSWEGDPKVLGANQMSIIDRVLSFYADKTPEWLSERTHIEDPWRLARESACLGPGQRGDVEITPQSMLEYYADMIP